MASDETWLTTGEVAKRLGVTQQTVQRWIRRGDLPGQSRTLMGQRYRVHRDDLKQFIARRQQEDREGSS